MTGLLEYVQIPNTQDSPPKIITQGVINMKGLIKTGQNMNIIKTNNRGKKYSKPSNNSFMYDHQKEKHNSSPLDCKLNTKWYYGKDRLACQVAEAVPLKMRTGEILNTKGGEFHNPPLVSIRQEIQRGLRNMT